MEWLQCVWLIRTSLLYTLTGDTTARSLRPSCLYFSCFSDRQLCLFFVTGCCGLAFTNTVTVARLLHLFIVMVHVACTFVKLSEHWRAHYCSAADISILFGIVRIFKLQSGFVREGLLLACPVSILSISLSVVNQSVSLCLTRLLSVLITSMIRYPES